MVAEMMTSHGVVGATTKEAWNTPGYGLHVHRKIMMHMHFFWGHNTEILFSGWPGSSSGMYALALIFVFVLAVLVEWLSNFKITKPGANKVASGLFRTAIHTVRSGLSYMVMLAVLSFNGGVFLAAVAGHAVGHVLFGNRVFKKGGSVGSDKTPHIPATK